MNTPASYAEVDRRVKFLRRIGTPEGRVAAARADLSTRVASRYRRDLDRKRSVVVPNRERLDAIRADLAAAYHIEPDDLFRRTKRNPAITGARRSFVVAARDIGYSTTELAVYMRRPGAHSSILFMQEQADLDAHAIAQAALLRDRQRRGE